MPHLQPTNLIHRLASFPPILRACCQPLSPEDSGWKPSPAHWSIAEIVAHMLDEEIRDFRPRLRLTLELGEQAEWVLNDPEANVREIGNRPEKVAAMLDAFERERADSVAWLRSLDPAATDWNRHKLHPKFPPITCADLLASWAAHDALHLRQIAKRLYQLAQRDAPNADINYAGEWTT